MHFIDNMHIVKDNMFPLPPLFRVIHEQSGTSWKEMYMVFNMGHRFEIYTSKEHSIDIIRIAEEFNLGAQIIGHCESSNSKKLTIVSESGSFEY
jgi:phosphoribosylformylglycinamidine cyclo-ligase